MKIEKTLVERYYIKEDWTYADIHISNDGSLMIRSDYGDYAYKWGSFGNDFKNFLIGIGNDYLINKLGCGNGYIFDYDSTINSIKKEIIKYKRENKKEDAREIWEEIESLDPTDNKEIFFMVIMNTKYFEILCFNDPYNIPIEYMVNPQLNSFLKEIWPCFIEELKKEKNNG